MVKVEEKKGGIELLVIYMLKFNLRFAILSCGVTKSFFVSAACHDSSVTHQRSGTVS